jgi:hypothetical protein
VTRRSPRVRLSFGIGPGSGRSRHLRRSPARRTRDDGVASLSARPRMPAPSRDDPHPERRPCSRRGRSDRRRAAGRPLICGDGVHQRPAPGPHHFGAIG